MATIYKRFDAAESAMRTTLDQLFELRSETLNLKKQQAEINATGNKLFKDFQKQFKASLQIKKSRRAAKKLKSAPEGN
jgi:hypothetical protein